MTAVASVIGIVAGSVGLSVGISYLIIRGCLSAMTGVRLSDGT